MSDSSPLRVAIIGGGLGGLSLAGFINQHSSTVQVDLYEKRPDVSAQVGEGISIWKRSWEVLRDLGIEPELQKRKFPLPKDGESVGPIFRKGDDPNGGFDFHNHVMPYGPVSIPRPQLAEMLVSRLTDNTKIHTSKSIANYTLGAESGVTIAFEDGSSAKADVIVGSDGVKSTVRALLFEDAASKASDASEAAALRAVILPRWNGQVGYRTSVELNKIKAESPDNVALSGPKIWCGKGRHVVSVPIVPFNQLHLLCYDNLDAGESKTYDGPWVEDSTVEELQKIFTGWEPDLQLLLKNVVPPRRWVIHEVEPLPFSVQGPVALLGDAAHAMTTHQGVGGGSAIEDAYLLGRLLAHEKTNAKNVASILKLYEEIRLPLAQEAAAKSSVNGKLYDFVHPDFPVPANASKEQLVSLGEEVGRSFAWLGQGGAYDEWDKAEAYVRENY